MKLFIILALTLFIQNAFSQTSTYSLNNTSIFDSSRFSFSGFYSAEATKRNTHDDFDGLAHSFEPSVKYKLTDVDSIRLRADLNYITGANRDNKLTYDSLQLHYNRKKILTQAKNGIDMSASWRHYYTTYDDTRRFYGSDSENSLRLYYGYQITNGLRLNGSTRAYYYILNDYKSSRSWHMRRVVDVTPEYKFNDDFKVSLYTEYEYIRKLGRKYDEEHLTISPGIRYNITRKVNIFASVEMIAMKSWDDVTWNEKMFEDQEYNISLNAYLF